jgi:nicotinate-nucleotide--dimethylbenzimidazole phosphoribosyltransferase
MNGDAPPPVLPGAVLPGAVLPAAIGDLCQRVRPVEHRFAGLARIHQLTLARPGGSLGDLDHAIRRVAAIRRALVPAAMDTVVSVLAGDHGVAMRGVSAYPYGHTGRVLELIAAGQAPVSILAGRLPARVVHADVGLAQPVGDQRYKVAAGTRDLTVTDALTAEESERAVLNGARYAVEQLGSSSLLVLGEIGIGNTTAASALAARLLRTRTEGMVGSGSGVPGDTVGRKRALVEQALRRIAELPDDPLRLLRAVGGLEIAANVGVILAAAGQGRVVLLDGVITAVSALVAVKVCPPAAGYLLAGHQSSEPAHAALLASLRLVPLLRLNIHLGMASGAALAAGVLNSALAVAAGTPAAGSAGLAAR